MTTTWFQLDGTDGVTLVGNVPGSTSISPGSGGTATFANSVGRSGTGARFANGASAQCLMRLPYPSASLTTKGSGWLTVDAATTGTVYVYAKRHSAGYQWQLVRNSTTKKLFLTDRNSGSVLVPFDYIKATDGTTDLLMPDNAQWRIEERTVCDATTFTATVNIAIFNTAGTRMNAETNYVGVTVGTTATMATTTNLDVGVTNAGVPALVVGWDQIGLSDDSGTSYIGPFVAAANNAPVVTSPAGVYVAAGTAFTLTMTATDSDGTIASRKWVSTTRPSGATAISDVNAAGATYTLTTPGVYTFTPSATDNGGATGTGTAVTVSVYAADGSSINRGERSNQGWTGAASNLSDADNNTAVTSPNDPSNVSVIYDMNPIGPGDITFSAFQTRLDPTLGFAPATCKMEVLGGGAGVDAVIKTVTASLVDGTIVTPSVVFTTGENTAMTTAYRSKWAIRLTANKT